MCRLHASPLTWCTSSPASAVGNSTSGKLSRHYTSAWTAIDRDIRKKTKEKPVAAHFCSDGHTLSDFSVVVVDQLHQADPVLRKNRESRWIRLLQTEAPKGINLRVDRLWKHLSLGYFLQSLHVRRSSITIKCHLFGSFLWLLTLSSVCTTSFYPMLSVPFPVTFHTTLIAPYTQHPHRSSSALHTALTQPL